LRTMRSQGCTFPTRHGGASRRNRRLALARKRQRTCRRIRYGHGARRRRGSGLRPSAAMTALRRTEVTAWRVSSFRL
jgi:hypothetical protein